MSMTRIQLLLGKIAEECNEVAQRALKAQQFGLDEVQDGQSLNNGDRLRGELCDLAAVCAMVESEARVNLSQHSGASLGAKMVKVEKFLQLSQSLGMVEGATP